MARKKREGKVERDRGGAGGSAGKDSFKEKKGKLEEVNKQSGSNRGFIGRSKTKIGSWQREYRDA